MIDKRMNESCYLIDIPIDMFRIICTYHTAKDLNNITLTTTLLSYNGSDEIKKVIRALWFNHIKIKWKYDDEKLVIPNHIDIRKLYPMARTMLGSYTLLSTNEDINLLHINNDEKDNDKKVTFLGQVGMDNRSVQSSVSFPMIPMSKKRNIIKPLTRKSLDSALMIVQQLSNVFEAYTNKFFDKTLDDPISYTSAIKTVDFVYSSPFLYQNPCGSYSYYVLPRCVAYYEVIIKKSETINNGHQFEDDNTRECIAIGLSSSKFERVKMLPGWDIHSYGYHSDDGGIYHGVGRQLSQFGPSFGLGDIVGCGIDYRDHSIFYTLNGNFLGKAFKNIQTGIEFFPTIGIDANVTVEFNYGEKIPFSFDLISYMASISFFIKNI
jgi:hypothetical protein